ncbi:MAG: lipopolysaccharide heptosyltransferase II [Nitrospirales bacterium]
MLIQEIHKIVVRAPNWIGDAVMCTPALLDLRASYPRAHITLWGRPAIVELLKGHPGIDHVMSYEHQGVHSGLLGKYRLIKQLRLARFDLAILLQNAFEAAFLTFLAGIPNRWGYGTDGRSFLLSKAVPVASQKRSAHQVQYYQLLMQSLVGRIRSRGLQLVLSNQDEKRIDQRFPELMTSRGDYLIGLNPGSVYGSSKRWLPDRFAELAERVMNQIQETVGSNANVTCVVVGGVGEESLAHAISSLMRSNTIVLTGKTTLRELMGIIKRCSLFLTNDTGPMHIAAAFNVPMVAIFGSTDPHHTAPYGLEDMVVQGKASCSPCFLRSCPIDHRCMTQVSVQQAYEVAMKQFLRKEQG